MLGEGPTAPPEDEPEKVGGGPKVSLAGALPVEAPPLGREVPELLLAAGALAAGVLGALLVAAGRGVRGRAGAAGLASPFESKPT